MKCINNKTYVRKRRDRKKELRNRLIINTIIFFVVVVGVVIGINIKTSMKSLVPERYSKSVHLSELYSENIYD